MSNMIHTPAPWHVIQFGGYFNIMDEPYYEGKCITDADNVGEDVAEANATLMAAAPELLKACELLLEQLKSLSSGLNLWNAQSAIEHGEAAIKKANLKPHI